ncbi:hypothetical protein GDO81_015555 [Engystomops pustulosus]|uniref:Uncharacterized protein n=1 Tax=Engystomops pustulosus TaxID=76066 RepID=A0AAV7AMI0_ENGPU|nr:hypothetical protein GDO81_015555 [Engystomops pustulosus]
MNHSQYLGIYHAAHFGFTTFSYMVNPTNSLQLSTCSIFLWFSFFLFFYNFIIFFLFFACSAGKSQNQNANKRSLILLPLWKFFLSCT